MKAKTLPLSFFSLFQIPGTKKAPSFRGRRHSRKGPALSYGRLVTGAQGSPTRQKRYKTAIETFMIGKINILDLNDAQKSKDEAVQKEIEELYLYWNYYYNIRSITLFDFLSKSTLDAEFEKIVRN